MTPSAIEELREVMEDPQVQRVLAGARACPGRPTAARLIRIAALASAVLQQAEAEGEGGGKA